MTSKSNVSQTELLQKALLEYLVHGSENDPSLVVSVRLVCTDNLCFGFPAPCGLWGCKNWPAPFPGRMAYKATKPGLVSVFIS